MNDRVKCTSCDNMILLSTAKEYMGLCAVCAKANGKIRKWRRPIERFSLEDGYRSYIEARNKKLTARSPTDNKAIADYFDISDFRTLAAYEIRLYNDVRSFRERITHAVKVKISILNDYDSGGQVDPSFVTMTGFHWGLDALAAGDLDLGRRFYRSIGNRKREEAANDSKFISSIGYAAKELVSYGKLSDSVRAELEKNCSGKGVIGYRLIMAGIECRNAAMIEQGIDRVISGHRLLTRPRGIFFLTPDEMVCFWAMGLINFAIMTGIRFSVKGCDVLPRSLILENGDPV